MDGAGRVTAEASVRTPFRTGGDGDGDGGDRVEMDVESLRFCLQAVLADLGDALRLVAAVGLAGMAESGAPLDGGGRALAPVIGWHDRRGAEAVARLDGAFGPDLALRIGQPPRPVLTVAKLGWLVANGVDDVDRWLGVPELVLHDLTGAEATEFSLAARTGGYHVVARQWMPEVADVLGFPVGVFAEVRAAGTVMGRVSAAGAAWSGLAEGTPVTVAGHDHLVGMAGAAIGRGSIADSVGTAESLVRRCPTVPDVAAALGLRLGVTLYPGGEE
ncbi:MAG: hypothetical protein QOE93_1676, partial [Actinomycetota bacterium]|nr:hypothetical protein [Actinomycetota bacterium]